MGPLQQKAGCNMYYDPAPNHWIRAVPIRRILGRLGQTFTRAVSFTFLTVQVSVALINIFAWQGSSHEVLF
jgi:hypothetical protein